MKKVIISLIILMAALILLVVGLEQLAISNAKKNSSTSTEQRDLMTEVDVAEEDNPVATIKLSGYDEMKFELFPMQAPQTVYNFITLANSGFYNGLTMHRLEKDFVIQGGDPKGDGTGGPGYGITGEFPANGYTTNLTHKKGSIAMARSQDVDSAGSQFYISLADNQSLDANYAVFGYITDGEDVVDQINEDAVEGESAPKDTIKIESIKVDTKGINYPEAKHVSEE